MSGLFGHVNQNDENAPDSDNAAESEQHGSSENQDHQPETAVQTEQSNTVQADRFSVGIDLGTTHCVLSYVDLSADEEQMNQQVMAIPQ